MSTLRGMSLVTEADLKRLMKALHHGSLREPITRSNLIEAAFGHVEEHLDGLIGSSVSGAKAMVVAVLAERAAHRTGSAELAHSGPASAGTRSKDTVERIRELLGRAEHSVFLLGVSPADARGLLPTLEAVSDARSLDVTLVLEDADGAGGFECPEGWRVYQAGGLALKTRALICDRSRVLLTSDALSAKEDEDALHIGALIDDGAYASTLLEELEKLVKSGRIQPR